MPFLSAKKGQSKERDVRKVVLLPVFVYVQLFTGLKFK
jgi:hypothetical protein